jgi:predicted bacteriocin transport accessory protein
VKKIFTGVLCLLLLCGCTSSAASSSSSASPSASATVGTTADPAKKVTITNSITLTSKTLDMSGYKYLSDKSPAFIQITMKESLRLIDEKGSGIVLYSYATCPWCNRAVPVLNEVAKEMGIHIYYVDVYEAELMSSDGKSFSTEGKAVIQSMLSHYDTILRHEANETTGKVEPTLYTPEVVAIKQGMITSHHTSLVDDFTMNSEADQLSEAQTAELAGIYEELIRSAAD